VKTLLTIDFDFFVPEDPMWDLGHNESPFFMQHIWYVRSQLMDAMKTNGEEKGFWKKIQDSFKFKTDTVHVSESHLEAFHLTHPLGQIINIDRHHDVWEGHDNMVACDTWGHQAMRLRHVQEMKWIHPSDGGFEINMAGDYMAVAPEEYQKRVEPMTMLEALVRLEGTEIDTVHICRSAAWTPPWLDEAFTEFVAAGPFKEIEQAGDLPVEPRWSEEDFKKAREHKDFVEKTHRDMNEKRQKRLEAAK